MLKEYIFFICILFSFISIPTLVYSIVNKNKDNCSVIKTISIICIVFLFIDIAILPSALDIEIGMIILFFYLMAIIAGALYIASIVISGTKSKNLQSSGKSNRLIFLTIALLILSVVALVGFYIRDVRLINNSNLILVYYSRGNGGFGDGETFAYTISDNYCEQIDLGIDSGGYKLKNYIPKNMQETRNIDSIEDYTIEVNSDSIQVYKNNETIFNKNHKSYYSNIEFERGFVKQ